MSELQEKKQLLRSCESCRASKIRCMPDEVSDSDCKRCKRLGKSCVFSEVKSRSRRNAASNARRVQDLEQKIDRLSSLLQEAPSSAEDPDDSPSGSGPPLHNPALDAGGNIPQLYAHLTPPDSRTDGTQLSPTDVIAKGWLTTSQAEELVRAFHLDFAHASYFVVVPSASLEYLRHEKPNILLAMLVTSSRNNYAMQQTLEQEFKSCICNQLIMEGTRSLELVQGLLIFISWYHHRFRVMDKKLYMFLQMTIAMSLDLDLLEKAKGTVEENVESLEIKRTLFGIYFHSSNTSLLQRRPMTLKYSLTFWDCARSLAAANQAPLDSHLTYLASLQCLLEEIAESFGYINDEGRRSLTLHNLAGIDSRVSAFRNRLEQIRASILLETAMSLTLICTCDSVAVYLYEVALHIPVSSARENPSEHDVSIQNHEISTLSNLLWECLNATKVFMDLTLRLTDAETIAQSVLDKGHVAHAAIVLIKLAFARIPGAEGFPLRQACNVCGYFDAMSVRVAALSFTPEFAEHQDCFQQVVNTVQVIKRWYEKMESSSENFNELKSMNTMQLVDIAKDNTFLDFDWRCFDTFFTEGNGWSSVWV